VDSVVDRVGKDERRSIVVDVVNVDRDHRHVRPRPHLEKQTSKVSRQKEASLPHTDRSIVFADVANVSVASLPAMVPWAPPAER